MPKKNIYPKPATRVLSDADKTAIKKDIMAKKMDIYDIARKHKCSPSQVAGVKSWVPANKKKKHRDLSKA